MKLNKKGFTLVELLAVIIILAIVIGITIPAVLKTINNSRISGGEDAAEIVANWIDDQYLLASVDGGSLDDAFKANTVCGPQGNSCSTASGVDVSNTNTAFFNAVGLKPADVKSVNIKINTQTGKSCITLTLEDSGSYYITAKKADGTQYVYAGKGCDSSVTLGHSAKNTSSNS